jgi:hypothetical protein
MISQQAEPNIPMRAQQDCDRSDMFLASPLMNEQPSEFNQNCSIKVS